MDRESGWNSTILRPSWCHRACAVYEALMHHAVSPCTSLGLISYSLEAGMPCEHCAEWLSVLGVPYLRAALPWQQGLSGTIPWCHWRSRRTRLSRPCPGDCPAVGATQSPGTAYSTWSASSVHWWRRCLFSCHLVLPVKIKKHHWGDLTAACLLGNEWMWKQLTLC